MVALADPTLESLEKFADPSLWEVVRNVPVFDEHEEQDQDDDGQPVTHRFDHAKLTEIADNCNRREQETGDACPITLGHTRDNVAEDQQPEIVGYARRFRVGTYGPTKKRAVVADFYIRRDRLEEVKKYPRRSIELWPSDLIIDPIALLRRTPQRDLGLLTYRRDPAVRAYERRFDRRIYQMQEDPVMDMNGAATTPPPAAAEALPPEHAAMAEQYAKHLFGMGGSSLKPLMGHLAKRYGKEAGCPDMGAETPMRMEAAVATPPAAGNTYTPGLPDAGRKPEEVARMEKDSEATRYARVEQRLSALDAENKALRAEVDRVRYERDQAECERMVTQLESENYELDRAEEVKAMVPMTPESRTAHVEKIRKRYRRLPLGNGAIHTLPNKRVGQPKQFSRSQRDEVFQLMKDDPKLTYELALEKIAGS